MKDSKNIYTLLNEIETNIDDYEKEELNDIEKQNLKNNFRKSTKKKFNFKKLGTIAVALALAIGILGQTNFGKNVYAAAESKISEISYSIGKALGIKGNIEPCANVVDQIVKKNGVEVKLDNVIVDKNELFFSTVTKIDKPMNVDENEMQYDFDIYVNGKMLTTYTGSFFSKAIDDSENMFFHIYSINNEAIDATKDMDIKIVLHDLYYEPEKCINGKWTFEFTANGTELAADTYVFPLNYSFNIGKQNYNLKEFRWNPVNKKIIGTTKGNPAYYYIVLEGHDDLGNKVIFNSSSEIYNEDSDSTDLTFEHDDYYGELSKATSITLTPYVSKPVPIGGDEESDEYKPKQVGEEFTIFLKK